MLLISGSDGFSGPEEKRRLGKMAVSVRQNSGWILDASAKETQEELAKLRALSARVKESLSVSQEALNRVMRT
jgi:hypothetical protein